jgi:hypothetical protein
MACTCRKAGLGGGKLSVGREPAPLIPVVACQVAVKPISVKIRLPLECEAWTSIL